VDYTGARKISFIDGREKMTNTLGDIVSFFGLSMMGPGVVSVPAFFLQVN